MTPEEVETAARNRYNAASDTFFSQAEAFDLIYQAETILAQETLCIETRDTSITTVAGTRAYPFPTNVIDVKRVEYDGRRLTKIDVNEDDILTALSADTTTQGTPAYYFIWNDTIYLREIPDAEETLTLYGHKLPTALSTSPISTSLSVPTRHHTKLVLFLQAHFAGKDKDYDGFQILLARWDKEVEAARKYEARRKRVDAFAYVKDEESQVMSQLGVLS